MRIETKTKNLSFLKKKKLLLLIIILFKQYIASVDTSSNKCQNNFVQNQLHIILSSIKNLTAEKIKLIGATFNS